MSANDASTGGPEAGTGARDGGGPGPADASGPAGPCAGVFCDDFERAALGANWTTDNSVATNVPGQSGQPGSEYYDNLLPLWEAYRYFPLVYSRAAVERETKHLLVLEPRH